MSRITREKKSFQWDGAALSVISLIISMLISAVVLAASGYDPIEAYVAIVKGAFGSLRGIAQTFTQATPLIFTGLAFAFAKKATLINLGVEGQMYMGALGTAIVAAMDLGLPAIVHVPLALLAGIVCGGAFAAVIGFLKVRFGSNEVVAGVMLNSIATLLVGYLLNGPLLAEGSSMAQTEKIMESARLPRIFSQYQLTIAIFIAMAACVVAKWFISRTALGYEIRAVGFNAKAAETAGISRGKVLIVAMCISGAIAGLAGASHVLGVDRRLISGFSPGYGFNGIAVAALAADSPVGAIFAGIIFGILRAGAMELNRGTGIPVEFVDVIQAMVVVFVSAPLLVRRMLRLEKKPGGKHRAVKAGKEA